jgi:hypothetical protein
MLRWLINVMVLGVLFAVAISGVRMLGARASDGKAASTMTILREFAFVDDRWCWRELCLGQTPYAEATIRLRDKSVFSDIINAIDSSLIGWGWMNDPSLFTMLARQRGTQHISRFAFTARGSRFSLADAIRLFGTPEDVYIQSIGSDLAIQICFAHKVCVTTTQPTGKLTPSTTISGIDYVTVEAFNARLAYGTETKQWRGFLNYAPRWWIRMR